MWSSLLVTAVLAPFIFGSPSLRRVCYYTNWSQYRPPPGSFTPEDVDPFLCTHIVFSFAKIINDELTPFEANDDDTDDTKGSYTQIIELKDANPRLKVLLAVGGYNLGSASFSRMVASAGNRKYFIRTSIKFLRDYDFDGLDLDWEYPTLRGGVPEDKRRFTLLVQELAAAFDRERVPAGKSRLILSAAVAGGKNNIDSSYEISLISKRLDMINLMTYDYHGSWEPVTGHNSPLYGRSGDTGALANSYTDYTATYWVKNGAPRSKLNIGLATYGRTFTLDDPKDSKVGSPAAGPGPAGQYTREPGFMAYYEICQMIKEGAKTYRTGDQQVPYLVQGDVWVGYDDPKSLRNKVQYIKDRGYGGAMVWALDLDDFSGATCGGGAYPLVRAIREESVSNSTGIHSVPNVTLTTTRPDSSKLDNVTRLCKDQHLSDGLHPQPGSCAKFVVCVRGVTLVRSCLLGTVFSSTAKRCVLASRTSRC